VALGQVIVLAGESNYLSPEVFARDVRCKSVENNFGFANVHSFLSRLVIGPEQEVDARLLCFWPILKLRESGSRT
jgi:hypothetical protein